METSTEKQEPVASESTSKTAAGDEAVASKLAEGDDNKAEAGKGKKRIGRVSQEFIDLLLHEKATGTGAYKPKPSRSMQLVEQYTGPRKAEWRALVYRQEAIMEELRAGDAAILEQYHRLGYAYTEVEEDDSFIYDEKIFGPIARSRPPPPLPTA